MKTFEDISSLIGTFQTISLSEMDCIKLMNRTDTKFVLTMDDLFSFLGVAGDRYRVLFLDGMRIYPYDTLYYDTDGLDMYLDHHNRRLVRQKVRVRTYLGSGLTFLEVKKKNNKGRTKKKRIECDRDNVFSSEQSAFLQRKSGYLPADIRPALSTRFNRITLVNNEKTERLTIDLGLVFDNSRNLRSAAFGNLVIMELKQDGAYDSPARHILSELRIHQFKVSKYCIGQTLTDPSLKSNRFKVKVRKLDKILKSQSI